MFRLHHDRSVGTCMATVHPVVPALGKGLEAQLYLASDKVASQILKLAVRQTREVVGHNGLKERL